MHPKLSFLRFAVRGIAAPLLLALLTSCQPDATPGPAPAAQRYHCPMHPTYVSDRPGDCPICNMKLVVVREGDRTPVGAAPAAPVDVPGRVVIHVSPEKQQTIGLKTETVRRRRLTLTVRAAGALQHDETALTRVAPRFAGWVQKLQVNFTGQPVTAGDPLLTVYSPELLSTERDYLLALRQSEDAANRGGPEQRAAADQLLQTARQRLRLYEVSDAEIEALAQRGEPHDEILLRAPVSGHVIAKTAVEGRAFMAGETLFEMGRLDRLWVRVAVPEQELSLIRTGQTARVTFPYLDGRQMETSVEFISPHLDPVTRRGEVRLALENPDHSLRPEMWVQVEIERSVGPEVAVPTSAVIDTGTRQIAFVRRADHHLEPRELKLGVRAGDYVAVLGGLEPGEDVVTRALFLIDSESQLKAAIAAMAPAEGRSPGPALEATNSLRP